MKENQLEHVADKAYVGTDRILWKKSVTPKFQIHQKGGLRHEKGSNPKSLHANKCSPKWTTLKTMAFGGSLLQGAGIEAFWGSGA